MINSAPPTTTTTTTIPTTVQSNLTTLSIESIPWFGNDYDEIIDCGVRTLFNTISISIIDNRIYQFNMDLSVTIYDQSSKRLNDDRNYCNLTTGRKFFLQNLNTKFIDMNIELENLINFLPKTNSLLHNYFGIALRQEINPTNIRFDVFIKNMTNINDNGTNQYEYSSHSSITNDIESLSNMMNKYLKQIHP
ncbi:hypothetical protein DERP_009461 [Dermatophagoides pteronyssinus]|uniref:Uncharacterized protein n=1 Tax=Dermatophagoides pteronyssinus TaxID=6956 RepID=A0ABQ8IUH9_DERPT|nr:hypothetical protein DERP_009461 [Dermatophagoides pteronyssinus]